MITLLCVMGDSDVRAKDTEVGKGTPLTSPFIEGIYEMFRRNDSATSNSQIPPLEPFGFSVGMTWGGAS